MTSTMNDRYDAIVIGSGHAGCEAALCLARLRLKTIVFTVSVDNIAYMPCNPHIGGSSKGHLVREIDALGGEMGRAIDETFLQMKLLNRSKGAAVHALRAQADKAAYSHRMRRVLENEPYLTIKQAEVVKLLTTKDGKDGYRNCVTGVETASGLRFEADTVIVCTGTYLKARCLTGEDIRYTGPNGMPAANHLSASLEENGIRLQRFKTGTPARMDGRSIRYDVMEPQYGDVPVLAFSFDSDEEAMQREQEKCYLTYTNEKTHEIIRNNIDRSPMYSGVIEGVGPRYCPSIEDKVVRFADKDRHQVFIEPEGKYTNEMYIDGMSSSLPEDVQIEVYRSVKGLEHCEIVKPAYAIEYDCLCSGQLKPTLEAKEIRGLYFAGQMNGSSGYEEAAAQGLYAAANAYCAKNRKDPFLILRSEGYIGVLVDDLVTKEHTEPYRMMTSRAEYRLLLRQDNADLRLREKGYRLGLVTEEQYRTVRLKQKRIEEEIGRLSETFVGDTEKVQRFLKEIHSSPVKSGASLKALLARPEITYPSLSSIDGNSIADTDKVSREIAKQVEIAIKYEGYIERTLRQIEAFERAEAKKIPGTIDYADVKSLRKEAMEKLQRIRPENVGQASRIAGVNPADIQVLMVYLKAAGEKER